MIMDVLTEYNRTFEIHSHRRFQACPTPLKQVSKIVADNYGVISVCNEDNIRGLVSIHYTDAKEEEMKAYAREGKVGTSRGMYHMLKGFVFDRRCTLISRGFSFTPKIVIETASLGTILEKNNVMVRRYLEGTVLMISTYQGRVLVSATRKIDATSSRKDRCPSNEEMLTAAGVNLDKLVNNKGEVYVILVIHPMNQLTNPVSVTPIAYHIDTWAPKEVKKNGKHGDPVLSMRRKDVKIDLPTLPCLKPDEALKVFAEGNGLYVQSGFDSGVVYLPKILNAKLCIRGDRDHLYHRFVELGTRGGELLDAVPAAMREEVAGYPLRYTNDIRALKEYVSSILMPKEPSKDQITPLAEKPIKSSSLSALITTIKGSMTEITSDELDKAFDDAITACKGVVVYNMLTTYRTKIAKSPKANKTSLTSSIDE
jgi:hypothetical protein